MVDSAIYDAPTASHPSPRWRQIRSFFYEELKPRPGKLRASLVRVAGVTLGMWMGFGLDVPEVSAVLAFAFFASSSDPAEGKKVAFGVPPVVLVIYLLVTLVLSVFGPSPLVRTVLLFAIIFASMFLLQAAKNGAVFMLAAVFGKVFLTLYDEGYPSRLLQYLQLWIIGDLALAGACAFVAFSLFGNPEKEPAVVFRRKLAVEFNFLAETLSGFADGSSKGSARLHTDALSASDTLLPLLDAAAKKDTTLKEQYDRFTALIRMTTLLLHESVALNTRAAGSQLQFSEFFRWAAARCLAIAKSVRSATPLYPSTNVPDTNDDPLAQTTVATLNLAQDILAGRASLPKTHRPETKKPFFRPDAFTNPIYNRNAFRVTLAALACYCLIAGADWSGIGTAMTTCLITALTTVPQSRQKQTLRIAGASAGAVFAFLAIVAVLPYGGGITTLTIVTVMITFIGAWIYASSPKLNYAGVQLVLCYYLGAFGEGKTPTSLTSVRDRVVGIFIGNLAMWLFYDRIRPAWTVDETRCDFAMELTAVGVLAGEPPPHSKHSWTADLLLHEQKTFQDATTQLRTMADPNNYEFKLQNQDQRASAPRITSLQNALEALFSLEYAAAEAKLLGLPNPRNGTSGPNVSVALTSLAAAVEKGKPVFPPSSLSHLDGISREDLLFAQIATECSRLYTHHAGMHRKRHLRNTPAA